MYHSQLTSLSSLPQMKDLMRFVIAISLGDGNLPKTSALANIFSSVYPCIIGGFWHAVIWRRDGEKMKKMVALAAVMTLAFTLAGCGGNDGAESAASVADPLIAGTTSAGKADVVAAPESSESTEESSSSDAATSDGSSEQAASPWNIPNGEWLGYDRFSGEQISGSKIIVYEMTAGSFVFDFYSGTPDRVYRGLTVFPDSSGHAMYDSESGVTLEITLSDNLVAIDEIEGMGAIAYDFKK